MTPSQLNILLSNNDKNILVKAMQAMKIWTPQEKEYLENHFSKMKIRDIAKQLKRSEGSIKKKAEKMCLTKNETVKTRPAVIVRPPAIYSNINHRERLLNQYAPQ